LPSAHGGGVTGVSTRAPGWLKPSERRRRSRLSTSISNKENIQMATASANLFAEKYLKDLGARNKRVADLNRPSHAGLDHIGRVLGSADSRFVSFERIGSTRKDVFQVTLVGTGFIVNDGVQLVLRREEGKEYEMSGEFWTLEVRFVRFGLRRRVTIENTVDLADFCCEIPAYDPFA
jgi:hypothetical protein